MDYRVVVTVEAEEDLNQFIQYLLWEKQNEQAAKIFKSTDISCYTEQKKIQYMQMTFFMSYKIMKIE